MAVLKELIHNVISNFENSLHTRYEIWKVKTLSKTAEISSSLLSFILILIIGVVSFLVLSFGLAYWIGSLIKNTAAGFFIVGGFYIILCIAIFKLRTKVINPTLENFFVNKFIK